MIFRKFALFWSHLEEPLLICHIKCFHYTEPLSAFGNIRNLMPPHITRLINVMIHQSTFAHVFPSSGFAKLTLASTLKSETPFSLPSNSSLSSRFLFHCSQHRRLTSWLSSAIGESTRNPFYHRIHLLRRLVLRQSQLHPAPLLHMLSIHRIGLVGASEACSQAFSGHGSLAEPPHRRPLLIVR